ncbi:MAG: Clp protease N-terminal domain-containing protein [Pirellulales bacterium]|nr:Clp protease N-terminal domain-containing protein [Pirellulales bacterium]
MSNVEVMDKWRCTKGLMQIVEQLPARFAVRSPMILDHDSLLAVALWTMLRWERTPLMIGLEDMGVNVWELTREVDALLENRRRAGIRLAEMNVVGHQSEAMLDHRINQLLDKVKEQARAMGYEYLGPEHLLLAILSNCDHNLFSILSGYNVTRDSVTNLLRKLLLDNIPSAEEMQDIGIRRQQKRRESFSFTSWDSEAVGVPRRFGMSIMFMMMTMYAILFAFMKIMGTPPVWFAVIAVFVTGVGFAQMALFGGRFPRAASIWAGAVVLPIEIIVLNTVLGIFSGGTIVQRAVGGIGYAIPFILLGAFFGYLSGGLTAGAFLLIDMFGQKNPSTDDESVDEQNVDEQKQIP